MDEEGCENLAVRRGDRKLISRNQRKRRVVSGLVRKVSQKVVNNNKEPLRRRGSRRSRSGSRSGSRKSIKRGRSFRHPQPPLSAVCLDAEKAIYVTKQSSLAGGTVLQRVNTFLATGYQTILLLLGCQPKLAEILTSEVPIAAVCEKEEIDLVPKRYRPDNIDSLCRETGFSKPEMKRLYRVFKSECPTGMITEDIFHSIFSKFFPLGAENYNANVSSYSHYVFSALSQEDSEAITFEDFALSLSLLLHGSEDEKLEWIFQLYDLDGDGFISKDEMEDVAVSIYELMGDSKDLYKVGSEDGAILRKVEKAFQKLDLDGDGVVSLDEFLEVCKDDKDIQLSLLCINDLKI